MVHSKLALRPRSNNYRSSASIKRSFWHCDIACLMDRFALSLLGLHWPILTYLQARRVQFRLQSAQECSYMVAILERRGMEFQQQRPRTGRPASARSEADEAGGRPLTTQTYSAKSMSGAPAVPHKQTPFNLQALEAGGLSSQKALGPRKTTDAEPTISRQQSTIHPANNIRPQAPFRTPTIDASHSLLARGHSGQEKPATRDGRSDMTHGDDNSGRFQMTSSPARPATSGLYQPSAPASLRLPDTLEHEMPPRRELPFKRPGSHQSASSRPSTSAKSTAGADSSEPTVASSTLSPAESISAHRPATASPLKRPIAPSHLEPTKKALAVEMRPQSHGSLLSSASSFLKPTSASTNDGTFRRPSDLGELLRNSKPLAERSPNSNRVTRMDSTADAQYELETPPGTSSSLSKTTAHAVVSSSPTRIDGRLATSSSRPDNHAVPAVPGPSTISTDSLARASTVVQGPVDGADTALADYASQSREDRQAVLDEFMVSKLEDPNFAVLCEDLDSCWRRIALGL